MEEKKTAILIVDDEQDVANAFMKQLTLIGDYDVTIALGGKHALEMLAENKYDAMLLDLIMPEIDGVEVLKTMSSDKEKYSPLPVLVLTNVTSDEARKQTADYGVSGYIVKTNIEPELLIEEIQKAIDNFGAQPE